jgi:Ankyrin repeats (3 copies)
MDVAATFMGIQIAAAESRSQGIIGGSENGSCVGALHRDDPLSGPDGVVRRTHIRQELAAKGFAAVDEILAKNSKIEDVMILAARGNMVDVVSYCSENKGADATKLIGDVVDDSGMDSAAMGGISKRPKAMDCLLGAIEEGAAQVVEYLLTRGGANANAHSDGDGAPALWAAAQSGHVYIIKLLLQHGANVMRANRIVATRPSMPRLKMGMPWRAVS